MISDLFSSHVACSSQSEVSRQKTWCHIHMSLGAFFFVCAKYFLLLLHRLCIVWMQSSRFHKMKAWWLFMRTLAFLLSSDGAPPLCPLKECKSATRYSHITWLVTPRHLCPLGAARGWPSQVLPECEGFPWGWVRLPVPCLARDHTDPLKEGWAGIWGIAEQRTDAFFFFFFSSTYSTLLTE